MTTITRGPAIRSLDDIRDRCVIDADTGCWLWSMQIAGGTPRVSFYPPGSDKRISTTTRRAVLWYVRGEDLPAGHVAFQKACCQHLHCCNPAHTRSGSKAQWGQWLSSTGRVKSLPTKRAAALKGWDKRGRSLLPEMVREIRSSQETLQALADRMCVDKTTVARARRLETHLERMNGASVFSWSGAA